MMYVHSTLRIKHCLVVVVVDWTAAKYKTFITPLRLLLLLRCCRTRRCHHSGGWWLFQSVQDHVSRMSRFLNRLLSGNIRHVRIVKALPMAGGTLRIGRVVATTGRLANVIDDADKAVVGREAICCCFRIEQQVRLLVVDTGIVVVVVVIVVIGQR
jgi:hypothetical protein